MKLKDINVSEALENAKQTLHEDKGMSSSTQSVIQLLILILSLLIHKFNLNSSNSSKSPSSDPNRMKKSRVKPYEFKLLQKVNDEQKIEPGRFYLCVDKCQILYQCFDPTGNLVQAVISQKDLPSEVIIPKKNDLEQLNKIRKHILKVSQERGDTAPLKKPGGQPGHVGVTLKPIEDPDEIKNVIVDKRTLPKGHNYQEQGYVSRQVVDIKISRHVVEYRAHILADEQGKQYIAKFPEGIGRDIQYGETIKSRVVFASVYQLIPYQRVQEQFAEDYQLPVSTGSIANFIKEAASLLREQKVDALIKSQLTQSSLMHSDETSININGKKVWLHTAANEQWSWLEPHPARGSEAMKEINILPNFQGTLSHDHWKPYFCFDCAHSLCNAHHLRELKWSFDEDGQKWAKQMHDFLLAARDEVEATQKHRLSAKKYTEGSKEYRAIIAQGEVECPEVAPKPGRKRKPKQTKSRNLLSRLRDYEGNTLLFMKKTEVPFTNNLGERDIRMSKVRQKISGCFKSLGRAKDFFVVRSYLQTCKKNNMNATGALELLFKKQMPDFLNNLDSG